MRAAIVLLAAVLAGCAPVTPPPFSLDAVAGICAFQPIGEDEAGVTYFRLKCRAQP